MKHVNKKAKKVMDVLTEGMDKIGDHRKIDNTKGAFMAVHIEHINNCNLGEIFSISHYFEQNSDLMRDPDMEFIKGGDSEYYPISFWQDAPLKRDETLDWGEDGKIKGIKPKLQAELATFSNMWMKNIKMQQKLVI